MTSDHEFVKGLGKYNDERICIVVMGKGFSSGLLMKELGLGKTVVLPSAPTRELVLHGEQNKENLAKILGVEPTAEDMAMAIEAAAQNEKLDRYTKEVLRSGVGKYRNDVRKQVEEEMNRQQYQRMAGQVLAGAGGAAGLIAVIDYLQGPKMEESYRVQ